MATDPVVKLSPLRYEFAPLPTPIIATRRSAIERGVLKPGVRLMEGDLCEQLDASRTSLRERCALSHTTGAG